MSSGLVDSAFYHFLKLGLECTPVDLALLIIAEVFLGHVKMFASSIRTKVPGPICETLNHIIGNMRTPLYT
jgi:hypothetical protein